MRCFSSGAGVRVQDNANGMAIAGRVLAAYSRRLTAVWRMGMSGGDMVATMVAVLMGVVLSGALGFVMAGLNTRDELG
jgi:hypothetical protein